MKSGFSCVINAVIYAVALNILLPLIAKQFATPEEIKPPGCPSKLSLKGQIIHMLVHHDKLRLSSSIIVATVVALSITLGYRFKIVQ
jgi:hypothetical protein